MFDTLFSKEWVEEYHKELLALIKDKPEQDDSMLWPLVCALEDVIDGKISGVHYIYDHGDGEKSVQTYPEVPISCHEDLLQAVPEDDFDDFARPLGVPKHRAPSLELVSGGPEQ